VTTLILLPGLACDAAVWAGIQAPLAARLGAARVHVSHVHFEEPTLPAMAQALLARHAGPLLLVGHSMGGMLALEAERQGCVQAGARVQAMALLGTTAEPDSAELLRLRSEAIELFAQGRMGEVLHANVGFALHPDNVAALGPRYLDLVRRAGAAALIAQNRAVMARVDSRPLLAQVRAKTLVMCGAADLLTPLSHSQQLAAGIPGAELAIVQGAGHMLTLEQPERVATLLLAWLAKVLPDRA
jgi:pimeloyl-ACP methyl ester carboxylesterase